jgi:hypothetical protein
MTEEQQVAAAYRQSMIAFAKIPVGDWVALYLSTSAWASFTPPILHDLAARYVVRKAERTVRRINNAVARMDQVMQWRKEKHDHE